MLFQISHKIQIKQSLSKFWLKQRGLNNWSKDTYVSKYLHSFLNKKIFKNLQNPCIGKVLTFLNISFVFQKN